MNQRQAWAVFFFCAILVVASIVAVQRGLIKLPFQSSANAGGSGGSPSDSVNWDVLGEEYDYVIQTDGTLFWAEHNGEEYWKSSNKTAVFDSAADQLTSGGTIYAHEVEFPTALTLADNIIIIETYQGTVKIHSNTGNWLLPQLASDPSTAGWGSSEKGRMWFNTSDSKIKYWDGTQIQELSSSDTSSDDIFYADYTIWKNITDSKYYAQDSYGNIDYSDTNASYVWNSAAGALPTRGGTIEAKSDIFEMDAPLVWVGGTSTPPSKTLRIIGAGRWATVFKATTDTNVFEVSNGASVDFEHFYIDMNSQDGYGIYGKNTGASDRSFQKGIINDVEIRGVTANYWAIYLQNPYITNTWDNIYIRTAGGGIYMDCDSTGYGNNHYGNIMVSMYGTNKIGVQLLKNSVALSLNSWERLHIDGGDSAGATNNLGLDIDGSNYNSFFYLEIENIEDAVRMGNTQATHGNAILSGYIFVNEADAVVFNLTANAEQNNIQNVMAASSGVLTSILINDENTDTDKPNTYTNIQGYSTGFAAVGSYIVRASVDASRLYGQMLWRKAQNSVVSANFQINHTSTQTMTITHALALTPQSYYATLQRTTDVSDWDAHVVEIYNVNITVAVVRINVTVASATNPSYAHIVFYGDVNG